MTPKTPKYAPANEAGEKPYVVVTSQLGEVKSRIVYATDAASAKYKMIGRQQFISGKARRALWGEVMS